MQRRKVSIFRALFARSRGDSRTGRAAQGDADTSASPLLTFIAAALFLILSIIETDLHRNELRTLGLIGGEELIDPALMAP